MTKVPWSRKGHAYERQEKRTAKKKGARRQLNSGRLWSSLRDVKQVIAKRTYLYDNKTTMAGSYTVKATEFKKLKRDSNRTPPGCTPVLQIDFSEHSLSLVVIEESEFDMLTEGR